MTYPWYKENGMPVRKFKSLLAWKGLKHKNNLCVSCVLPQEIESNEAPMPVHLHDPALSSHSVTKLLNIVRSNGHNLMNDI